MKALYTLFVGTCVMSLMQIVDLRAEDGPIIIYLEDTEETLAIADEPKPEDSTKPDAVKTPKKPPKTLDDLINDVKEEKKPDLTVRQKRIVDRVLKEQEVFLKSLDIFVKAPFNEEDDEAEPKFVKARNDIVDVLFKAPSEKEFYERLYLINVLWLDHQDQMPRFMSLDKKMRDQWLQIEEKRNRTRKIVVGICMVGGAAIGGYLSYKVSQKIIPVKPDDAGLAQIMKLVGRGGVVIVGAGVGAAVGRFAGFLGSEALMGNQPEYIDPIDGSEDLRDLLDVIEEVQ